MTQNASASRGFTLIELLISTAILGTAVISMCAVYSHIVIEIRQARNRTLATNMAQAMMEMIASSPYDATAYHSLTTVTNPPEDNPVRDDILVWKTRLEDFPTSAIGRISAIRKATVCSLDSCPGIVEVDVTITYEDYKGETINRLSLILEPK
ncbi:hypothetical protein CSA56_14420 [candidate division KSB3 bacterium]|uniref:Prepilin-type N-terminal cleavage/methylation domain-containing protein n=1 Tax=candidate division KSB3 bacterium TaxID=2044937 RepID=A0A2G6KCZ4_9BACT|nr:MAG: hypothetical protein CSA56_14420 [candidate division KSB3 bacterium]